MKILQLNVWMGKIEGNLKRFLEQNQFDVICMQEVMSSPDRELPVSRMCFDKSRILEASGMPYQFFSPNFGMDFAGGTLEIGNLILSRIPIVAKTSSFVHGSYEAHTLLGEMPANNLNIQLTKLENGVSIVNHHGFWRSNPMGDEETIKAFAKAGEIVREVSGPLVMCGDLNIIHSSPAMRALDFLRDLTEEYGIENTLSGLKFDGKVPCDHILINDEIEVVDFGVRKELVSDHFGLAAEVQVKE